MKKINDVNNIHNIHINKIRTMNWIMILKGA